MGFPNNARLSEGLASLLVAAYPTLTTAQTVGSVNLAKARKVLYLVGGGTLGTAATVTAKLQGSANGSSGWTDIANSSATLTKAGGDDNKWVEIETNAENVNALGLSYAYVRLSVGADVSSSVAVAATAGAGPEEPMSGQDAANLKTKLVV